MKNTTQMTIQILESPQNNSNKLIILGNALGDGLGEQKTCNQSERERPTDRQRKSRWIKRCKIGI